MLCSDRKWDGVPNLEETNSNRIPHSAPAGVSYHKLHLKCLYADRHMRSKQEELETLALSHRFEITGISTTWSCG